MREINNFIILIGRLSADLQSMLFICFLFIVDQPRNDKISFKWRNEATSTAFNALHLIRSSSLGARVYVQIIIYTEDVRLKQIIPHKRIIL